MLPNDPPNQSNNNPYVPQPPPPPPNPDPLSIHEEVAQHRPRDTYGHFLPYEHPGNHNPQTVPNPSPPLPEEALAKSGNPSPSFFQRCKSVFSWISKIKWKKMTLYFIGASGFLYFFISNASVQNLINHYFPNSSPLLSRAVSYQGVLRSSESGIYSLVLPNQETYTLHFKPSTALTNLKKLNEVVVKGNLTWAPYVIENAEIYPLNLSTEGSSPAPRSLGEVGSNLPKLYSGLTWEVTQSKTLLFTSGKRRIEQQGVYLESSQVDTYPQDFIDYYTNQLTNANFKQTFNSSEPSGTTITFAKDDLFLTFGVKNIYSGSGDNKKLAGYKAFIEHN